MSSETIQDAVKNNNPLVLSGQTLNTQIELLPHYPGSDSVRSPVFSAAVHTERFHPWKRRLAIAGFVALAAMTRYVDNVVDGILEHEAQPGPSINRVYPAEEINPTLPMLVSMPGMT